MTAVKGRDLQAFTEALRAFPTLTPHELNDLAMIIEVRLHEITRTDASAHRLIAENATYISLVISQAAWVLNRAG